MSTSELRAPPLASPPASRVAGRLRETSVETWVLAGVIAVAAIIRILVINNQSYWADEALTVYEAHLPFGAMMHVVERVETTPPLFFVLTWGWAKVFGTGEVALRAISTIAGIALVPIAYGCARQLFSRWAGVVAAAFVALNPFLIWYSQEARSYMLLAALTGGSFLCFLLALEEPTRRRLLWWAVVSALALMTHFFAGFLIAPEALWLLWRHRRRDVWLAVAAVAVVQLAMLPFAVTDTGHGAGWIAAIPRVKRITQLMLEWGVSITARKYTTVEAVIAWLILGAIVVALVALSRSARTRSGFWVASTVTAFAFLAPLVVGLLGQDYFLSRNLIPAFVPLAVVIAGACAAPGLRAIGAVPVVVLLAIFGLSAVDVQSHPWYQRPDWRAVAHALGRAPAPRAILVAGGTGADPLKIYLPGVRWVQPQHHHVLIGEIDIVGAQKKMEVATATPQSPDNPAMPFVLAHRPASPEPVSRPPAWATRLARFRVRNWTIARFVLAHPRRLDVRQLLILAHHFFRHTPKLLLVFFQRPVR